MEATDNGKKYEILKGYALEVDGRRLYRIRALKDFADVKAGDLGGYIQHEENLSQEGNCWVYFKAEAYDNSKVYGNAKVRGCSEVGGCSKVGGYAVVDGRMKIGGSALIDGILYRIQKKFNVITSTTIMPTL